MVNIISQHLSPFFLIFWLLAHTVDVCFSVITSTYSRFGDYLTAFSNSVWPLGVAKSWLVSLLCNLEGFGPMAEGQSVPPSLRASCSWARLIFVTGVLGAEH